MESRGKQNNDLVKRTLWQITSFWLGSSDIPTSSLYSSSPHFPLSLPLSQLASPSIIVPANKSTSFGLAGHVFKSSMFSLRRRTGPKAGCKKTAQRMLLYPSIWGKHIKNDSWRPWQKWTMHFLWWCHQKQIINHQIYQWTFAFHHFLWGGYTPKVYISFEDIIVSHLWSPEPQKFITSHHQLSVTSVPIGTRGVISRNNKNLSPAKHVTFSLVVSTYLNKN